MKEVPSCLPQGNQAGKQAAPFTCLAVLVLFPSAWMQSGALYTAFQDQRPKRPRRYKHKCCRVNILELATENNFWSHNVEIYSNPVLQENRKVEESPLSFVF